MSLQSANQTFNVTIAPNMAIMQTSVGQKNLRMDRRKTSRLNETFEPRSVQLEMERTAGLVTLEQVHMLRGNSQILRTMSRFWNRETFASRTKAQLRPLDQGKSPWMLCGATNGSNRKSAMFSTFLEQKTSSLKF